MRDLNKSDMPRYGAGFEELVRRRAGQKKMRGSFLSPCRAFQGNQYPLECLLIFGFLGTALALENRLTARHSIRHQITQVLGPCPWVRRAIPHKGEPHVEL